MPTPRKREIPILIIAEYQISLLVKEENEDLNVPNTTYIYCIKTVR